MTFVLHTQKPNRSQSNAHPSILLIRVTSETPKTGHLSQMQQWQIKHWTFKVHLLHLAVTQATHADLCSGTGRLQNTEVVSFLCQAGNRSDERRVEHGISGAGILDRISTLIWEQEQVRARGLTITIPLLLNTCEWDQTLIIWHKKNHSEPKRYRSVVARQRAAHQFPPSLRSSDPAKSAAQSRLAAEAERRVGREIPPVGKHTLRLSIEEMWSFGIVV